MMYDDYQPVKGAMLNENISVSPYCYQEFVLYKFLLSCRQMKLDVFRKKHKFLATEEILKTFIDTNFTDYHVTYSGGYVVIENELALLYLPYISNNSTTAYFYGQEQEIERAYDLFYQNFKGIPSSIEWVYNKKGDKISLPLSLENQPIKEFYPFLGEKSLEEYYTDFMLSRASILILIGPPGTGKTTFLRGLISHSKSNALVSYDVKILEDDDFFAEFVSDEDSQLLVLEDADSFLRPRKDGNHLIMRFLNMGDGLVSSHGKKIIFTTNLPSIKEIDPALIRPGRCFDIITFDNLTAEQANTVNNKLNLENPPFESEVSLAEIFNKQHFSSYPKANTVGFI
jgi:hypothetical protein